MDAIQTASVEQQPGIHSQLANSTRYCEMKKAHRDTAQDKQFVQWRCQYVVDLRLIPMRMHSALILKSFSVSNGLSSPAPERNRSGLVSSARSCLVVMSQRENMRGGVEHSEATKAFTPGVYSHQERMRAASTWQDSEQGAHAGSVLHGALNVI